MFLLFLNFLTILALAWSSVSYNESIVQIELGEMRGKISKDYYGKPFYSFEGIPYAQPPIGDLRFKAPQPPEPWQGTLDATKRSQMCLQSNLIKSDEISGSEDCLYLNVYTKELPKNNDEITLKPVMFWIHGGSLQWGSPYVTGPGLLMAEDVVLVTIAYRLNIFGFLSFEDSTLDVPGNAGLKDQVLALKWVQENIKEFGGDPDSVTIFGQSAGGSATHILSLSPLTKGLFHRVIAQSGSAMNQWFSAPRRYQLLSNRLECGSSDSKEILKCIKEKNGTELLKASRKLTDQMYAGDVHGGFSVVVEEPATEDSFLSEPVKDIIASGKFNQVPFLTGFTTHEGAQALMIPDLAVKPNFTDVQILVPNDTNILLGTQQATDLGNKIKDFYFGASKSGNSDTWAYIEYNSDVMFLEKIYKTTKLQAAISNEPVYFYQFDYFTTLNMFQNLGKPVVSHCDDLAYLFVMDKTPTAIGEDSDMAIGIHRLVKWWTSFAATGNPNPVEADPLLNVTWEPVTKEKFNYLYISPTLEMRVDPEKRRMEFWEDIYNNVTVES